MERVPAVPIREHFASFSRSPMRQRAASRAGHSGDCDLRGALQG